MTFLLSLLFPSCSNKKNEPKTDLEAIGLKGNVKSVKFHCNNNYIITTTYNEDGYILTNKSPEGGSFEYIRDSTNKIIEERAEITQGEYRLDIISYKYDKNNKLEEMSYGPNKCLYYKYDEKNNLIKVIIKGYEDGKYIDEVSASYEYDDDNNQIEYISGSYKMSCKYDNDHHVISKKISGDSIPTIYKYDNDGRLIEEGKKRYKYDENNSIIEEIEINAGKESVKRTSYKYDDKGNWIKQYDENGDEQYPKREIEYYETKSSSPIIEKQTNDNIDEEQNSASQGEIFQGQKLKDGEKIIEIEWSKEIKTNYTTDFEGPRYSSKTLTVPYGKKWILLYIDEDYTYEGGSVIASVPDLFIDNKMEDFRDRRFSKPDNIHLSRAKDENLIIYSKSTVKGISSRQNNKGYGGDYIEYIGKMWFLEINE